MHTVKRLASRIVQRPKRHQHARDGRRRQAHQSVTGRRIERQPREVVLAWTLIATGGR